MYSAELFQSSAIGFKVPGFRRKILISAPRLGEDKKVLVRAGLEDDFHHFLVELGFQDGKVTSTQSWSPRSPYVTCPAAGLELQQLVSTESSPVPNNVFRQTDGGHQCTHMLDLAGLAIRAYAVNTGERAYDIFVSDIQNGQQTASLSQNGELKLKWIIENERISAPDEFQNIHLKQGFAKWVLSNLSHELAEDALILRRCAVISIGRTKDLEKQIHAENRGVCYSQQPIRADTAYRIKGSIRNFNEPSDGPFVADRDWICFKSNTMRPDGHLRKD